MVDSSGVNWGLGLQQGPNPGEAFNTAFQQGQQRHQQDASRRALAALVANPNDPKALAALAQADPQMAMQYQGQQQHQQQAGIEHRREDIVKGAQIFRQFGVKDEASYQAARQAAQQMGIDVSQVPPTYNPQYVEGVVKMADTFAPQTPHNGQLVSYQQGGGVARINPQTGQLENLVIPNEGGHAAGSPVGPSAPPPDAIARLRANPHEAQQFDEIFGPGASQGILSNGGQSVPPTGGFPQRPY